MDCQALKTYFKETREQSEYLCRPLKYEDYIPQPISAVSPPKWHLAHTTWFFEVFILREFVAGYKDFHPDYNYVFNSYYQNIGDQWDKHQRGFVSRPGVDDIYEYRHAIDERMERLFQDINAAQYHAFHDLVVLGCNHEQQHQELLATDIKYILATNPFIPSYTSKDLHAVGNSQQTPSDWDFVDVEGGLHEIGYQGDQFHMDNERPVHKAYLYDFKIQNRLITNGEFLQFVEDGGYDNVNLWLDDGWSAIKEGAFNSPLYWRKIDGQWYEVTLAGLQPLKLDAPVTHLNLYEADAFATWAGKRLPTEYEWEVAARHKAPDTSSGNFVEQEYFHPTPLNGHSSPDNHVKQMYGDVWEWTYSSYLPYPGYKSASGALGEYNGKFMINQMVLRGGSCATPSNHFRLSYRNFFTPDTQFQFSGLRLADDR